MNTALKYTEEEIDSHDCHAGPESSCPCQVKDLNQSPDPMEPKAFWCTACDKEFLLEAVIEHDDAYFCSDSCIEEHDLGGIEDARALVAEYRRGQM